MGVNNENMFTNSDTLAPKAEKHCLMENYLIQAAQTTRGPLHLFMTYFCGARASKF